MGYLRAILAVLFMATLPSAYGGSCFKDYDVDDCRVKAEQGDARSQGRLGGLYNTGQGVVQDYKEAVKWFRLAAEQGDSSAQHSLGLRYTNGQGVVQDYREAVKWWKKAAEQGHSLAQHNLGLRYYLGQGVIQDYVMAHMYWNIASVSGDKDAIELRGIVEKDMTSSQIAEAQKLAREWMRTHQ